MNYHYSLHGHAVVLAAPPGRATTHAGSKHKPPAARSPAEDAGTRQAWGTTFAGDAHTSQWYCIPCPIPFSAPTAAGLHLAALEILVDVEGAACIDRIQVRNNRHDDLLTDSNLEVTQNYLRPFTTPLNIGGAFLIYLHAHFGADSRINFRGSNITLWVA
ncbi:MAG: hypothetical protein AVDCRST_MAG56-5062 [uncultured Cytophagales bacterium]|uniref:Uncharacterized protein n=1 Tax=uncultured Cytophagales bacterium TaxID=158755 RepID=A0A6J4K787_9SPHI|nr:MAG: hypothetical protein AVDCRST_MAG56-5062 [uncultured Cytophagales bacterium]